MQESRESPCSASAGHGHVGCFTVFTALPTSTDDCASATVSILGLQRNFSEYASSQIRNPQIMRIGYVMKLDMLISNADFLLDIIKGTERVKTANAVPAMWMVHLLPSVWTSWIPQQYGQCHALGNSPLSL